MATIPANRHHSTPGVGWAMAHSTRTRTREGPCGHRHAHSLQRRGSHSGAGGDRNESALGETSETSCHGNSVCRSADVQGKQANTRTHRGCQHSCACGAECRVIESSPAARENLVGHLKHHHRRLCNVQRAGCANKNTRCGRLGTHFVPADRAIVPACRHARFLSSTPHSRPCAGRSGRWFV